MKHLILSTILGLFAVNANAQILHDNCWDQSFAYNYMTIEKETNHLKVVLSGSTIFNLNANSWEANSTKTISIPLDYCRFSDDELLVNCNARNIAVKVNRHGEAEKSINLSFLEIDLSFVERARLSGGFNLTTHYQLEGTNESLNSSTIFRGKRASGCFRR